MMLTSLSTAQVFQHSDMESMTKDERRFAEEQLRAIFSHQMSKVSTAINKKKQLSSNLLQLEHQHELQLKKTFDRLNQRMTHVDSKRKEQLTKRIETCRSHDERWRGKMTQIQKRMKQQNRRAEQRVKQYREEQDSFMQHRKTHVSKSNHRRNSTYIHHSSQPSMFDQHHRYSTQTIQRQATKSIVSDGMTPPLSLRMLHSPKSKNNLDQSIRNHRIKSHRIQIEKQKEIFQRALVKLQTITQRRKKMISLHQQDLEKKSDISKSKRQLHDKSAMDLNDSNRRSISPKTRFISSTTQVMPINTNRRPIRRLFDHSIAKRQRELKQFMDRGDILQRNVERSKKQHILKQIRQKVNQFKMIAQRGS